MKRGMAESGLFLRAIFSPREEGKKSERKKEIEENKITCTFVHVKEEICE